MLPHKHAIVSAAIGAAAWWTTRDWRVCAAAIGAGVLPDLDHIVDYSYYRWRGVHRLILPLHGYEYALLSGMNAVTSGNNIQRVATLSYLAHLLGDQIENQTHRLGYSLLFRAWRGFRVEDISKVPEYAARGREEDLHVLKRILDRLSPLSVHAGR